MSVYELKSVCVFCKDLSHGNIILIFLRAREAQYNPDEGVVKLYLRGRPLNLYVPTALQETYSPTASTSHPPAKLKLEWVYGYRGRDCRNNVYQLPTGEIVYFVAAVVVLYNVEDQMQRHYLGHTDDIKSLAVHPNKLLIATGQTAGHDRRDARSWRLNPPADHLSPEAEEWVRTSQSPSPPDPDLASWSKVMFCTET
ncbi:Echinoderm microtubule-associated protein-like 1-like [Homarus americanus]|uniref:Echinoderm microtubule-associated protein-like 1-like n=1 Tax=Homarus americanus TaxID=6706 RepID=A0A8J5JYH5_HOMAM|nr:Echinoderm microtubule-associated protein-like 1-like [Homarus americanus]